MSKDRSINQLLAQPEFNRALDLLLSRRLKLTVDARRQLIAEVVEVEPFSHLKDARYQNPFRNGYDRTPDDPVHRTPGGVFVLYPQGQPTLSVVDDPEQQSIVVIKQVAVHNARMSVQKLLTDKAHGNMRPEAMREFIRSLDGVTPGPGEPIEFEQRVQPLQPEIERKVRDGVDNSLGIIRRK